MGVDGSGGGISAEQTALESATDTFNDYGAQFENTITPLGTWYDDLVAGCGEFSDVAETGASKFLIGWRETFLACSETAGIIAGNVGGYWIDLEAVDVDQTVTVTI